MNYPAFTNQSLTMMYAVIGAALAADFAFKNDGGDPPFRVLETAEWKKHAAELEAEMLRRGMFFEIIDWSEGQAKLPLNTPGNRSTTCAYCEPMCARTEAQLADRLKRKRQLPDVPIIACSKCGSTDWATTNKFVPRNFCSSPRQKQPAPASRRNESVRESETEQNR